MMETVELTLLDLQLFFCQSCSCVIHTQPILVHVSACLHNFIANVKRAFSPAHMSSHVPKVCLLGGGPPQDVAHVVRLAADHG